MIDDERRRSFVCEFCEAVYEPHGNNAYLSQYCKPLCRSRAWRERRGIATRFKRGGRTATLAPGRAPPPSPRSPFLLAALALSFHVPPGFRP